MSKNGKAPGFLQRLRARPTPSFPDAADLGTCFGLEVSLDQIDEGPVLPAPASHRGPGWMQRWAARNKPAL